jgi:hypothetical protein
MTTRAPSPGQLEQSFTRVNQLQAELQRKERAIGRKVQILARGLAGLMEPGAHLHRIGVGLHAFDVDGAVCLAAAYLEPEGDDYRHRYAVLCGGEAAKRALRTAVLDPSDCDEPGRGVASPWRPTPTTTTSSTGSPSSSPTSPAAWMIGFSKRRGSKVRSGLPAGSCRRPSGRRLGWARGGIRGCAVGRIWTRGIFGAFQPISLGHPPVGLGVVVRDIDRLDPNLSSASRRRYSVPLSISAATAAIARPGETSLLAARTILSTSSCISAGKGTQTTSMPDATAPAVDFAKIVKNAGVVRTNRRIGASTSER